MVHYCPGSAIGSPATMRQSEAEQYLKEDIAYLGALEEVESICGPIVLPHIGQCPPNCPHRDGSQNEPDAWHDIKGV